MPDHPTVIFFDDALSASPLTRARNALTAAQTALRVGQITTCSHHLRRVGRALDDLTIPPPEIRIPISGSPAMRRATAPEAG